MKLSTATYVVRERYGEKEAIRLIKEAGFDAFDISLHCYREQPDILLSDSYRENVRALREYADSLKIPCNQAHAPFEFSYGEAMDESSVNYLRLVRSVEAAAIMGAKNIVVHGVRRGMKREDFWDYNQRFYRSLLPYCEKFDICVSVENLYYFEKSGSPLEMFFTPEEHKRFVDELDSEYFNICLDIGHIANCGYNPAQAIVALGKDYVKSVHVHDNDAVNDLHLLPYQGKLNWDEIMDALAKIGYPGDFTFEVTGYMRNYKSELLAPALKFEEQVGRALLRKTEEQQMCSN